MNEPGFGRALFMEHLMHLTQGPSIRLVSDDTLDVQETRGLDDEVRKLGIRNLDTELTRLKMQMGDLSYEIEKLLEQRRLLAARMGRVSSELEVEIRSAAKSVDIDLTLPETSWNFNVLTMMFTRTR